MAVNGRGAPEESGRPAGSGAPEDPRKGRDAAAKAGATPAKEGVPSANAGVADRAAAAGEDAADRIRVRRALFSVTDKTGIVEFARGLERLSIEILSTGGTAATLREGGVRVTDVASLTGLPEMLGGRVKTLHPAVHGGILADRDDPAHRSDMETHGIRPIEMVVVNLYAFSATVADPEVTEKAAIEKIDIGGPAMIRAAAKNHRHVVVVTDPMRYPEILTGLEKGDSSLPRRLARALARDAFRTTAAYDAAIAAWFAREEGFGFSEFPEEVHLHLTKLHDLRYGENPHQPAALYARSGPPEGIAASRKRHGKELSFTNYLDLDAALRLIDEFDEPTAVVIKHVTPCGVGFGTSIQAAWVRAFAADPLSAFGGVVGLNCPCDAELAAALSETFLEMIVAPSFAEAALEILTRKKNLRLIEYPTAPIGYSPGECDIRHIKGAFLLQSENRPGLPEGFEVVTKRAPTAAERDALLKAWRIVKRVKSNAIVLANAAGSVGIGCGQTSRIDSVDDAVRKAARGVGIAPDTVLASDAFFPFRDSIDLASRAGIRAVIQPGGSLRDPESVAAADEHGMAMVFTGQRAFLH